MKTSVIALCVLLVVTSTVFTLTLLVELKESRDLRRENQRLWAELRTTKVQAQDLEDAKSDTATKLAAKHGEVRALEARLAKAEAETPTAKTNGTTAGQVFRPYQLRAFLGNRFVGRAWIVPSNVTKDTKTGQINFEPLVVLEDEARRILSETNVVERDVVRYQTVNNNYSPYPYYWYYYPYYTFWGTNTAHFRPPGTSGAKPSTPVNIRPLVSGGDAWTPYVAEPVRTPQPGPMPRNLGTQVRMAPLAPAAQLAPMQPTR
jgi:hypothetical protein